MDNAPTIPIRARSGTVWPGHALAMGRGRICDTDRRVRGSEEGVPKPRSRSTQDARKPKTPLAHFPRRSRRAEMCFGCCLATHLRRRQCRPSRWFCPAGGDGRALSTAHTDCLQQAANYAGEQLGQNREGPRRFDDPMRWRPHPSSGLVRRLCGRRLFVEGNARRTF